ncbi:GNAT family N-acetyltransferase [Micromonospora sp. NPDC000089]|uniref:GNAT family N-acetyltransferase n=1 Tax=unclassified Micromonospora TaxID=2617518 RepID=UPI00368F46DE
MRPEIRAIDPADVPAVVEFSLRAWAPVFASFGAVLGEPIYRAIYPDWRESQARAVAEVCQDPGNDVHVAVVDGRPVGFVAIRVAEDRTEGEIYMLAVDPDQQRRGIGSALTGYAVEWLRAAGVTLAVVGTGGDDGHAPARRTYEKAGFVGLPLVRYYARLDG